MNPLLTDIYTAVGMLMANFGSLEYMTFDYLERHLSKEEFATSKQSSPEASESIESIRKMLKPVREMRNHIAHGHLLVRIDPESGKPRLSLSNPRELETMYLEGSTHVSHMDVYKVIEELRHVIVQVEPLFGYKTETFEINVH